MDSFTLNLVQAAPAHAKKRNRKKSAGAAADAQPGRPAQDPAAVVDDSEAGRGLSLLSQVLQEESAGPRKRPAKPSGAPRPPQGPGAAAGDADKAPAGSRRNPLKAAPTEKRRRLPDARPLALRASKPSTHVIGTQSWGDLQLHERIAAHLSDAAGMNFAMPTRIQQVAIPELRAGGDALIKSETGSGKTIAFILPVVDSLLRASRRVRRQDGTLAIMLAPTRELASQILDVRGAPCVPL